MFRSSIIFIRFVLFWLLYFFLDRLMFLIYFYEKIENLSYGEIAKTFLYGIRMDLSTIGYLSAIPLIIYLFLWFCPRIDFSEKIIKSYVIFLIVLFSLFTIINFNVYREWGIKMNYKIIDLFFNNTSEAIASSSSSPVVFSFTIFFLFVLLSVWLSNSIISYEIPRFNMPVGLQITLSIFSLAVCFLAIRGGWQLSPINQSMSYFSSNSTLNHAAINTEWNLLSDVIDSKYTNKNPFKYMPEDEAKKTIKNTLYKPLFKSTDYLTIKHPNVVLILMESFTADVVASLGGEKGISPKYELLAQQGISFSNIYASGDRTDKGLVAVISGFPALGGRSIIKNNDKQSKLPALSSSLSQHGYKTLFFYGGESEFSNQKSYILSHNYQVLIDKKDFKDKDMNSKWGAYDGTVFRRMTADLETVKEPFLATFLTLTNHEPFELPIKPHFPGDDLPSKFKSTSYYTDSCLEAFVAQAKQKPWFKNTLFVLVADHGHRLPTEKYENHDPHRFRIPLLFFGDVIKPKYKGTVIDKIGSQTDIAMTILNQLDFSTSNYTWGKDLLNPQSTDFAFYNWDGGFGVASKTQTLSYDVIGKRVLYRKVNTAEKTDDDLLKAGKAFMQQAYEQYILF